jgi:hypothetical protein
MPDAGIAHPSQSGPTHARVIPRRGRPPGDKSDRVLPGRSCHNRRYNQGEQGAGESTATASGSTERKSQKQRLPQTPRCASMLIWLGPVNP